MQQPYPCEIWIMLYPIFIVDVAILNYHYQFYVHINNICLFSHNNYNHNSEVSINVVDDNDETIVIFLFVRVDKI